MNQSFLNEYAGKQHIMTTRQGLSQLIIENREQPKDAGKDSFIPDALFQQTASPAQQLAGSFIEQEKQRAFEIGYREGIAKAQQDWQPGLNILKQVNALIADPVRSIDRNIQEKMLEITVLIAKNVIHRELMIDSTQISAIIRQAVELIPKHDNKINIHINPNDSAHIKDRMAGEGGLDKYAFIEDPCISAGGCKLTTDYSAVDVTVEKQLETICAQILDGQMNESN